MVVREDEWSGTPSDRVKQHKGGEGGGRRLCSDLQQCRMVNVGVFINQIVTLGSTDVLGSMSKFVIIDELL
jgi:hypothetical protein